MSVTGSVVTTHSHHRPVTSNDDMLGVDWKMPALSTLFQLVSFAICVVGKYLRR